MTTPTPKYQIGQEVFWLGSGLIESGIITGIFYLNPKYNRTEFRYTFKDESPDKYDWRSETSLFPTKQSLIESL